MDILSYINRMNQIYGNGQQAAPVYNTQQYLQGGRVGLKDGTSKKQLSFDFKAKKKPTTVGEATIDFIVEKGRQPKPSEVLQIKEKLKPLIEKIGCPGLAAGGRAKFQDGSTCYTRGVEKIKTGKLATAAEKSNFSKLTKMTGGLKKLGSFLFGPVEMGLLPLAVAGEGLYQNYANKRDLKKALDQMDIPQKQKDLLLEGFRQESRDLGGVGLETSAIKQPNIQEKLEEIGYGDRTKLLKDARAPIAAIREKDALAKQLKQQEIEKRTKEAYEDAIGRKTIDFKKGGRVSFKFGSMGRRGFLKLLAALGLSGAAAGTGLIKLGGKAVGKKAAVKAGVDIATGTQGMPSWFPALVNKVIKEGDDVTGKLATKERELVYTKKLDNKDVYGDEVTVYRDLDTGDIRVEAYTESNMGEAPIQLDYKAPSVIDEGKMAGKKTDPEFSAVETEPRVVNWDGDIEFDGDNIVGSVDDLMSDTTKFKNYAEGKKPTLKDIVTSKKKKDVVKNLNEDQVAQLDYIEQKTGHLGPEKLMEYDDMLYHKSKEGLASGGRVNYDTSLPDIEDIE